jgi:hypothetical protein
MNVLILCWLFLVYLVGLIAFRKSLDIVVIRADQPITENFEWLLSACYLLYLVSGRLMSGAWRSVGSSGFVLLIWEVIIFPIFTFFLVLGFIPAKLNPNYLALLLQQQYVFLFVLLILSGLFPVRIGLSLYRSQAFQYLIDNWRSSGAIRLMFNQYPPKTAADTIPWISWHFLSLLLLFAFSAMSFH